MSQSSLRDSPYSRRHLYLPDTTHRKNPQLFSFLTISNRLVVPAADELNRSLENCAREFSDDNVTRHFGIHFFQFINRKLAVRNMDMHLINPIDYALPAHKL